MKKRVMSLLFAGLFCVTELFAGQEQKKSEQHFTWKQIEWKDIQNALSFSAAIVALYYKNFPLAILAATPFLSYGISSLIDQSESAKDIIYVTLVCLAVGLVIYQNPILMQQPRH